MIRYAKSLKDIVDFCNPRLGNFDFYDPRLGNVMSKKARD